MIPSEHSVVAGSGVEHSASKATPFCADQPVTLTFRLRQGGGPYIPSSPSFGKEAGKSAILHP